MKRSVNYVREQKLLKTFRRYVNKNVPTGNRREMQRINAFLDGYRSKACVLYYKNPLEWY